MTPLYRFGPFELDVRAGELRKYGTRIRLQEQPLRILTMLLARPGDVVLREEIQQALWPNRTVVEFDQGINAAIKRLRTALGDSAVGARYIETLARRGYRFIGVVEPTNSPVDEVAAGWEDLAGRTIGQYRVLEMLGSGGMGVVYRAEDLQLGRKVALKVLHASVRDADPGSLSRFRREARAAAALSHPNICTIFAVEDFAGEPAIIMELLEGETMAARLTRGPLPFDQVRRLGSQLASALDAGHRAGIVHRDFKPANIILTASSAKIVDFGLAKAIQADIFDPSLANVSKTGAILGTLNYLSPEQAQGREVDGASDVFAFGAVLYEMVTGVKAFAGDNAASVIAAILERQPRPAASWRPELPAALEQIVNACLEKDQRRRPSNLADVARKLEAACDDIVPDPAPRAALAMRIPSRRLVLGFTGAAALLAAGWRAGQYSAIPAAVSDTLVFPPEGWIWGGGLAISPDGRQLIATVVNQRRVRQLWVRELWVRSLTEKILPGTEGASFPFWSPDSKEIGFFANGKLYRISPFAGSARYVGAAPDPAGGAWGSGGNILFGAEPSRGLSLATTGGVAPRPVTRLGEGEVTRHSLPQFLPDGRHFVFAGWDHESGTPGLFLGTLDSTPPRLLLKNVTAAQFAPASSLLFLQAGRLMAQEFDWTQARPVAAAFAVAGARIASNGRTPVPPIGSLVSRVGSFSVSQNGILAYRTGVPVAREKLVWHSRDGRVLRSAGEPGRYMELFLSRDGRSVAVNLGNAYGNLGLLDLATNTMSQLTTERPIVYDAVWSPDSRSLVYQVYTPPKTRIMMLTLGQPSPRLLLDDGSLNFPDDWSPDGKWILARKQGGRENTVFLLAADGESKERVLLKTKSITDQFQFSPDGRWLAYNSMESGRWEVYMASFPGMKDVTRISETGGCQPIWRGDGKELFYLTLDGKLMSVELQAESLQPLRAKKLFASRVRVYGGFAQYAADAAGERFLMIEPETETEPPPSGEPIHLMTNWASRPRE